MRPPRIGTAFVTLSLVLIPGLISDQFSYADHKEPEVLVDNRQSGVRVGVVVTDARGENDNAVPAHSGEDFLSRVGRVVGHYVAEPILIGDVAAIRGAIGSQCVDVFGERPNVEEEQRALRAVGQYGLCPDPNDPGGEPVVFDPAAMAQEFWTEIGLPQPQAEIDPGWAITGLRAYMETKQTTLDPLTDAIATPLGPLRLRATSHYEVDWGDGTVERYTIEGGPWPNGGINHLYQTSQLYDVVLRQVWTAEWRLGRQPWVPIPNDRAMTSTLPDFVVQQIQAVRER